jgi:hypothetical protein
MPFNELKTTVYQEIAIMHSMTNHPNIIKLIGFTEEPLSIVTKMYDRNLFTLAMAQPAYAAGSQDTALLRDVLKVNSKLLDKGVIIKGKYIY